ncbi:MAG: DUF4854 domain-containing protein [Eubacterium sp.]
MMKKKISALALILVLTVTACFLMVSCGSSEEEKKNDIETYMEENDSVRESFEESILSQNPDLKVEYDGDAIVVSYAYDQEIADSDVETYASAIESGLESQKDALVEAANTLRDTAEVDKVIIRYIFTDSTGKELATVEFESEQ